MMAVDLRAVVQNHWMVTLWALVVNLFGKHAVLKFGQRGRTGWVMYLVASGNMT